MDSSDVVRNGSVPVRLGRFAAGSLVASVNISQRAFHAGLGVWAWGFRKTAEAAGDAVPGATRLAGAAARAEEQASAHAAQAERRRAQAMAFARHVDAVAPAWSELVAETAVAPFVDAATWTLLLGEEARGARSDADRFYAVERGGAFLALAREAGSTTLRQTLGLAEAAARLTTGDPEPLRLSIDEGLAQMRLLAAAGELGDLVPSSPLDEPLQRRARLVVERSPRRFLDALATNGRRPRPAAVFQAAVLDAEELRVFLVVYPQTLSLIAVKVGRLLVAGEIELRQVEAFLRGRRRVAV